MTLVRIADAGGVKEPARYRRESVMEPARKPTPRQIITKTALRRFSCGAESTMGKGARRIPRPRRDRPTPAKRERSRTQLWMQRRQPKGSARSRWSPNGEVEGPRRSAHRATRAHTVFQRPRRETRSRSRTPPTIVRHLAAAIGCRRISPSYACGEITCIHWPSE